MIDLMPVATGPPVSMTNGGELSPPEPTGGTFAEVLKAQTAPAVEAADVANSPPTAPGGDDPGGSAEGLALQTVPEPEGLPDHPVEVDPLQQIAVVLPAIPSMVLVPAAAAQGESGLRLSADGVGNAPMVSGSFAAAAPLGEGAVSGPSVTQSARATEELQALANGEKPPPVPAGAPLSGRGLQPAMSSAPVTTDAEPIAPATPEGAAAVELPSAPAVPGQSVTRSARAVEVLQALANGEKPPPVQEGAPPSDGSPQPTTATAPAADDFASPAAALPEAGTVIETQGVLEAPSEDAVRPHPTEGRPAGGDPAAVNLGTHAGAAGPTTVVHLIDASTGEAAAPPRLMPSAPPLAEQVVMSVRLLRLTGREEIRLRLDPPDLGTVHVRVVEQDGGLTVQLRAELGVTAEAVQQALPQLRQALQQAQVVVQHLDVALGNAWSFSAGQPQHERGDEPGASASRGIVEDEDFLDRPLEPASPSGHRVDYRA